MVRSVRLIPNILWMVNAFNKGEGQTLNDAVNPTFKSYLILLLFEFSGCVAALSNGVCRRHVGLACQNEITFPRPKAVTFVSQSFQGAERDG